MANKTDLEVLHDELMSIAFAMPQPRDGAGRMAALQGLATLEVGKQLRIANEHAVRVDLAMRNGEYSIYPGSV